jgi:hypothetical protein
MRVLGIGKTGDEKSKNKKNNVSVLFQANCGSLPKMFAK